MSEICHVVLLNLRTGIECGSVAAVVHLMGGRVDISYALEAAQEGGI
jgi:hypothetical protein